MNKLLTIVVPAYNVEKYIERCLDSFINEKILETIEILVVDDGGNDKTLSIAEKYAIKYPDTIIPIHKENGGHGSVINYGIEHAKGKYFKVVDGDDWIDSEELWKLLNKIKKEKLDVDVIFSDYIKEYKYNNSKKIFSLKESFDEDKIMNLTDTKYNKDMRIEIHSLIYNTNMLRSEKIRFLEKTFYEDTEYVLFPLAKNRKIIYLPNPIYHYFIGRPEQSVSIDSVIKHLDDQFRVIDSILNFYDKMKIDENENKIKEIWESRLISTIKYRYTILIKAYPQKEDEIKKFDKYLIEKNYKIYEKLSQQNEFIKFGRKTNFKHMKIINFVMKTEEKMKNFRRKNEEK